LKELRDNDAEEKKLAKKSLHVPTHFEENGANGVAPTPEKDRLLS